LSPGAAPVGCPAVPHGVPFRRPPLPGAGRHGLTVPFSARTLSFRRAVHLAPLFAGSFPWGGSFLSDALVPVRDRVSFAKLDEVLPLPDLVGIQRVSFDWLLSEGLKEVLEEVSPIEDFTEQFQLYFGRHQFRGVKFSEEE